MRTVTSSVQTVPNFVKLSALNNYALHKTCLKNFKRLHGSAAQHTIFTDQVFQTDQAHIRGEHSYSLVYCTWHSPPLRWPKVHHFLTLLISLRKSSYAN